MLFAISTTSPRKRYSISLLLKHYPDFTRESAEEGRVLHNQVQRKFEGYLKCGGLEHGIGHPALHSHAISRMAESPAGPGIMELEK